MARSRIVTSEGVNLTTKGAVTMSAKKTPSHYESLRSRFPKAMEALENLGSGVRSEGPLDVKTSHLIQLAAAAVIQSEGGVHSHTRRAVEAGASPDEIYHALMLLVTPVGFPRIAAAVSWADDVINK
jgi:AhpD family alkylhydroperoxidase